MARSCPSVTNASVYLLGTLPIAEEMAYRRHVQLCVPCRREVDELEPVVRFLRAIKADIADVDERFTS